MRALVDPCHSDDSLTLLVGFLFYCFFALTEELVVARCDDSLHSSRFLGGALVAVSPGSSIPMLATKVETTTNLVVQRHNRLSRVAEFSWSLEEDWIYSINTALVLW